jgi:hypothetical protein
MTLEQIQARIDELKPMLIEYWRLIEAEYKLLRQQNE